MRVCVGGGEERFVTCFIDFIAISSFIYYITIAINLQSVFPLSSTNITKVL